jgi:hypothetical protein
MCSAYKEVCMGDFGVPAILHRVVHTRGPYHFVADVWRHADPEPQPYVAEAPPRSDQTLQLIWTLVDTRKGDAGDQPLRTCKASSEL